MQIGDGISSSFAPLAAGSVGVFLQGAFFGIQGIALLTNSHVIGAKPASNDVWKELLKIWSDDFKQGNSPILKRKTLYEKLGTMIPAFQTGTLMDNPPRGMFLATATNPKGLIFTGTNSHLKLTDLFCSISAEKGNVSLAEAIYQPRESGDFAVALLRGGVQYDNRARKGPLEGDKHAIPGPGAAALNKMVYKFGRTSGFTESTVIKTGMASFDVKATAEAHERADYGGWNGFSAKGDSGSAIFNEGNNWLGLLYAGDSTSETSDRATKCYHHEKVLAALKDRSTNPALAGSAGTA